MTDHDTDRRMLSVALWGVAVAAVGVVVALLAWFFPVDDPEKNDSSPPGPSGTVARTATGTLSPPRPDDGNGEPVPALQARSGELVLTKNHGAHLFTDAPDWNVRTHCDKCNVYFYSTLSGSLRSEFAVLPAGVASSLEVCRRRTEWTRQLSRNDLRGGTRFCINDNRDEDVRAVAEILEVDDDRVALRVTSWF